MKIGIDLRRIVFGETGGLTQWLQGTLTSLFARDPENQFVVFNTVFNYHLFPELPANVTRRTLSTTGYYDELQDVIAYEGDFDLLLRHAPVGVLERFPLERQIVCIPDWHHEAFPGSFGPDQLRQLRQAFNAYQTRGGAIATCSEFARRELRADPWTTIDDVFLMTPGLPPGMGESAAGELAPEERAMIPARPFFLYNANIWPWKNHERILEAFALFRRTHPDYEFVFTGHPVGWEQFQRACKGQPVRHLGYVRPRLLAELRQQALAMAHLSLYEGFGLPLLEAFSAGLPVACGDRAAMPEVAGDAALLCDPGSAESMAAALARMADDEALRQQLRAAGKQRLAAFSWDRASEALSAAFERVAGRARFGAVRISVSTPPVVSIVTPSFNQGEFIRQTVDSVLAQDYPHIDYRVMDGGSTDQTVAILKSYGDRVRWTCEKDRGQAHAINKGMALAAGEICSYLNSDDLLRPNAVSRAVRHFQDRPACDLVYGRDALIDEAGRYLGMYPTAEYSFQRLVDRCCISQPAAFWRKRVADRIGPLDESLHMVMDYDYWLRAGRAGVVIEHVPDILAHTRMHRLAKSRGSGEASAYHRRYYRELFPVSIRHAGYISPRYVYAWLGTRLFNPHPWTRRYEAFIVRVCQRWYYLRCPGARGRWGSAFTILGEERPRLSDMGWKLLGALNPRNWIGRPPSPRVQLEQDLLVGPDLTFSHMGGPFRLAGVPVRDSVLRVFRGSDEVAALSLQADQPADVCVEVPAGPVRIVFSESELMPDGRLVAFKLLGTTLFTEHDAA